MKKLLSAFAVLVATLVTLPAPSQESVGGRYRVSGTNFDDSKYAGTAEITVTSNNTCRIEWVTGGTTSSGICMRNGTSFAAGYVLGDAIGLVIYEINDDGSLDGLWTIADQNGVGTERLVPMR
jgi:hypothetical protein